MKDYLMNTYNRKKVSFTRGDGVYLWDSEGKKYLDALCGLAVTGLGHSHPEISKVIYNQSQTLIHTSNAFIIEQQKSLAKRLCQLTGMSTSFFCNSGAEAVEASIKIARKYGNDKNISNPKIIVMDNSFHGRTMATLSATGNKKAHDGFYPLMEGLLRVPFNNTSAISELSKNDKSIVAVLLEPIQGEGGIIIPDNDYLDNLRKICDENNWLLILDEVQSGFCRTGKWFGYQHSSILPDIVTVAKALGNGVPIGACLANEKASKILMPGSHGSTFGGNFLSTSVGLKVLDIMREMNLCSNVRVIGDYFEQQLHETFDSNFQVEEIRCKGLMIGIQLKKDSVHLAEEALDLGLVINITQSNIIRLLPPLILNKEKVDIIIDILKKLIK